MDFTIDMSEETIKNLLDKDDDQLFELLGMTQKAIQADISKIGSVAPEIDSSKHMGPRETEAMKKIGERMFNKMHLQAHGLICGSAQEDKADRDRIIGALGVGGAAGLVAITSVLVGTFGMGPAIAGVIAALIINRFAKPVATEGYKSICEVWDEYLPKK